MTTSNDTSLLATPLADWQSWMRAALEAYREGDWLQLAQSPLAESALVESCLLVSEPRGLMARARAGGGAGLGCG